MTTQATQSIGQNTTKQGNEIMAQETETPSLIVPDDCQTVYFNGFSMAIGTGDVVIALQLNGKPSMVLNTSYTMAKTLGEGLIKAITELETKTHSTIMTSHMVAAAITNTSDVQSR